MAENLASDENKKEYWQAYYASQAISRFPLPSQFSVFVAGELAGRCRVLDIGCGGGRDSTLFASHDHAVVGVDGAQAAVDSCTELACRLHVGATFVCSSIEDPALAVKLRRTPEDPATTVIYARFFLHAITEEEELHFLGLARDLTEPGDMLAVEFRTNRDIAQSKVTSAHYRRFIEPPQFIARTSGFEFSVEYFTEGFGFAKYKNDDAHVARFIFRRK